MSKKKVSNQHALLGGGKKISKKNEHHLEAMRLLIEQYDEKKAKTIKAAVYEYIKTTFSDLSGLQRAEKLLELSKDDNWKLLGLDLEATEKIVKQKDKDREARLKEKEKEQMDKEPTETPDNEKAKKVSKKKSTNKKTSRTSEPNKKSKIKKSTKKSSRKTQ